MNNRPKILIVDDDPLNVKLLAAKLPAESYEILTAYDGREALQKVETESPDLVLLDVMMPGIDGYQVTRSLKKDPNTRDIPIVMVTALDSTDDKVKGLEAGADEFLNKPVNSSELKTRVQSFLRLRQYQQQLQAQLSAKASVSEPVDTENGQPSSSDPASILLVEDNDRDVRLLQRYLQSDSYRITVCPDGQQAIALISGGTFDLMLLDILLPDIDGFEICRRMKATPATRDIQIVVITSLPDLESKLRGLELGVDDFLVKPINPLELKARINALLKKKRTLDRLRKAL